MVVHDCNSSIREVEIGANLGSGLTGVLQDTKKLILKELYGLPEDDITGRVSTQAHTHSQVLKHTCNVKRENRRKSHYCTDYFRRQPTGNTLRFLNYYCETISLRLKHFILHSSSFNRKVNKKTTATTTKSFGSP